MDGDKYDCKRCRFNRHCDERGDLPGSRGAAPRVVFVIPDVIESRTCLLPMITPLSREMLRLYGHFKTGKLLNAGGIADQPAAYLEAMEIIEGTVNQVIDEKRKKEKPRGRS